MQTSVIDSGRRRPERLDRAKHREERGSEERADRAQRRSNSFAAALKSKPERDARPERGPSLGRRGEVLEDLSARDGATHERFDAIQTDARRALERAERGRAAWSEGVRREQEGEQSDESRSAEECAAIAPVGLLESDPNSARALEPTRAPDRPQAQGPPVEEIAVRLAASIAAGDDASKRRVVFVTLQVPGSGSLRARLTRSGARVDVRLGAKDEALRGALLERREALRAAGRARGVDFGEIRVA